MISRIFQEKRAARMYALIRNADENAAMPMVQICVWAIHAVAHTRTRPNSIKR